MMVLKTLFYEIIFHEKIKKMITSSLHINMLTYKKKQAF